MLKIGRQAEMRKFVAEANAEYHHWEKLRYLPTPPDVSAETAWQLVKWSRLGQELSLPLLDDHDRPFSYWLPNSALETLHEVDRWGGTTLAVPGDAATALGDMRDRVLITSLMEEAIATSQIEGAATTRRVAKELLRTNRKPRDRSEQMIVNSYRTIRLLRERLERPLSLEFLFEIQESMTRDTLDDPGAVGRLRRADENICVVDVRDDEIVFTPPKAEKLPDRLRKLIDFANAAADKEDFVHPLVKAAILHFWLAYEHPFVDGNGRAARALFYWYMLKRGYWLFEFLTVSRIILAAPMRYYRSFLYSEQDDNDLTYSVVYQLGATKKAIAALREYLAEKQREQSAAASALRDLPFLNYRQRTILTEMLRDPRRVFTFKSHRITQGITNMTARADLIGLVERGLLTDTQIGRERAFVPPVDLAEKLEKKTKRRRTK